MKRYFMALAAAAALGMVMAPTATALQTLSTGCQNMNDPFFDRVYGTAAAIGLPFTAGEKITITAGEPGFFAPELLNLRVNGAIVDTSPFPGTLEYTIPADGTYQITFGAPIGGTPSATWTVKCSAPMPTATAECKNGGWKLFDDGTGGFDNQGDCVSYVRAAGHKD